MSGQTLQRGWTFVRGAETITKTAMPYLRRALPKGTDLAGVVEWLNKFVQSDEEATRGSRSLPFGAGGTVVESVVFTQNVQAKVPHLLGTSNLLAFWLVPTTGSIAIQNSSFDATYFYVMPSLNWTGGVVFLVKP